MLTETATEFFRQLGEFSSEFFQKVLRLSATTSLWSEKFSNPKQLKGAIIHYTADDALEKAARWFLDPKFRARASAHVIVGDSRDPRAEAIVKQYPLVAALPVTVVQCVPPDRIAWHATWASAWSYGVECTNAGEVRPDGQGGFLWWPEIRPGQGPWSTPWRGAEPILGPGGRYWAPWPIEQVNAVERVLCQVNDLLEWDGDSMILGHEQVQGARTLRWENGPALGTDKRDPGPLFPLRVVREVVLHDRVPLIQGAAEDLVDAGYVSFGDLAMACRISAYGDSHRVSLDLLGYPANTHELEVIRIFQRMMGLKVDGIPGPITCVAIADRILDRYGSQNSPPVLIKII